MTNITSTKVVLIDLIGTLDNFSSIIKDHLKDDIGQEWPLLTLWSLQSNVNNSIVNYTKELISWQQIENEGAE